MFAELRSGMQWGGEGIVTSVTVMAAFEAVTFCSSYLLKQDIVEYKHSFLKSMM